MIIMTTKKLIFDILYFGVLAWVWSVFWQTPFAYFLWHMTWEQYINWVLCGLPITVIFFGKYFRGYLNWCDKMKEKHMNK